MHISGLPADTSPLSRLRSSVPARTVVLSSQSRGYYDAASTTSDVDYGPYGGGLVCAEDFYFTTSVRWIALARLRREARNNPYLAGLVNKYPEAIGQSTQRSRAKSKSYNDKKDRWWHRLVKRVTTTKDSLRTVEDILKRELLVAGELFFVKLANGLLQMIPSEYCGSLSAPADASSREVNGILYDEGGNIAAYRFGKLTLAGGINFSETSVVDARHVIHVFAKDRVHMGRGLPHLLPSLRTARNLYEITAAKTKQIKDVTSIFGTLEKINAAEWLRGLGGNDGFSLPAIPGDQPGGDAANAGNAAADPVHTGPVKVELAPGTFIALEPGEKLNKLTSDYQAGDYKELIMLMLHAISAPVGLPVELWFSGLGDVSYSGFKGLGTQWAGRRAYLTGFFEGAFLEPYHEWRYGKAVAEGDLEALPDDEVDLVDWRWRRVAILDEEKAARANQLRLKSGEKSLADIWEEDGLYAEEVLAARRELWIKLLIAAGKLKEGDDTESIEVPEAFLLFGTLPGMTPAGAPADDPDKDPAGDPSDPDPDRDPPRVKK